MLVSNLNENSEYHFASFANYISGSSSDLAKRSKKIASALKSGNVHTIESMFLHFNQDVIHLYKDFLGPHVTLVPVPRSHPLITGNLWPAKVIASTIHSKNYAKQVVNALERKIAIRSASGSSSSENRPLIHEHKETMRVIPQLVDTTHITIVDDIITQGRTSCACYELLKTAFPDKVIKIFAMMKTTSLNKSLASEKLIDPTTGTIKRYSSGKSYREP